MEPETKKENGWKWATFGLAIVLVAVIFYMMGANNGTVNGNVVAPGTGDVPTQAVKVSADNDAVLGDKDAEVTIIEFSDYQCPFCRKFWTETYPQIKSEYVDTGKVKIVFRDFPLDSIHPMATPAAIAAECVREKGGDAAYFEYHDKMFEEQNIMDSGNANGPVTKTVQFTNQDLKDWAKDLGYDISSCLDSEKYANEVAKDLSDGSAGGIRGTPAFVVNGQLISGAQPFSVFKQAIDSQL